MSFEDNPEVHEDLTLSNQPKYAVPTPKYVLPWPTMEDIVSHFPASECVIVAEFSFDREVIGRCYTVTVRSRNFSFPASYEKKVFIEAWKWERDTIARKVEDILRSEILVQKEIPLVITEKWLPAQLGEITSGLVEKRREIIGDQRHRI